MQKLLIVFMVFVSFPKVINAQTYTLNDFKETAAPKVNSEQSYKLNWSENTFVVETKNGVLQISEEQKAKGKGKTCAYVIPSGKLIGTNVGEWGGELSFQSNDTVKKKQLIKKGNISSIFEFQGKVYFMESLAHMILNHGLLSEIDTSSLVYTKVLNLDSFAPAAIKTFKDMILVASHNGFYVIKDFKRLDIIENACWSGLYPTSIAVQDEENVFIGLRGGLAKVNLNTHTYIFYQYIHLKSYELK